MPVVKRCGRGGKSPANLTSKIARGGKMISSKDSSRSGSETHTKKISIRKPVVACEVHGKSVYSAPISHDSLFGEVSKVSEAMDSVDEPTTGVLMHGGDECIPEQTEESNIFSQNEDEFIVLDDDRTEDNHHGEDVVIVEDEEVKLVRAALSMPKWRVVICAIPIADFTSKLRDAFSRLMQMCLYFEFRFAHNLNSRLSRNYDQDPHLLWYRKDLQKRNISEFGCLELHVAEPSLSVAMSIVHDMEFSRDIQIRVEMKLLAAGYIELCQTTKLDHDLEKGDVKPNPDLDTELKVCFSFRPRKSAKKLPQLIQHPKVTSVAVNVLGRSTATFSASTHFQMSAQQYMEMFSGVLINDQYVEMSTSLSSLQDVKEMMKTSTRQDSARVPMKRSSQTTAGEVSTPKSSHSSGTKSQSTTNEREQRRTPVRAPVGPRRFNRGGRPGWNRGRGVLGRVPGLPLSKQSSVSTAMSAKSVGSGRERQVLQNRVAVACVRSSDE